MKKTQINKHTEHHIGLLKAKLARVRAELEASTSKSGVQLSRFAKAETQPLSSSISLALVSLLSSIV